MRVIIEDTKDYTVFHHTGITRFRGCQCFKDCSCNNDFIPEPYDYYTVRKNFNKHKTTIHSTLEEVELRKQLLLNIPNKKYHENNTN